jgi:hypothetical protein
MAIWGCKAPFGTTCGDKSFSRERSSQRTEDEVSRINGARCVINGEREVEFVAPVRF